MISLSDILDQLQRQREQGNWYPANGGTERPFMSRSGVKLLYVYQPSTGKHAYLNCDTDIIIPDDEINFYL